MAADEQRVADSKRAHRSELAALPPSEKIKKLEALRTRAEIQRGARQTPKPPLLQSSSNAIRTAQEDDAQKSKNKKPTTSHRFGGRATATGVGYEIEIASFIGVKMLCGQSCPVWDDITGGDIAAITLQAPEPVDDIVVELREPDARIFISAKYRTASISLSKSNTAFVETTQAFVRQFLKLTPSARSKSRFVWAMPTSATSSVIRSLVSALEAHRREAGDDSIDAFLSRRSSGERQAMRRLISELVRQWKDIAKNTPTDAEVRSFFAILYIESYDFGTGNHLERQAEGDIRNHLGAQNDAPRVWMRIQSFFADANQRGIRVTPASLRRYIAADGITLKAAEDYSDDIDRLRELTESNVSQLKEHTILRFGSDAKDAVHIPRADELNALLDAAKSTHLLLTGDPGCGKSGLLYSVVAELQAQKVPVVLLLADEIFARDWTDSSTLSGLTHTLDEILANWSGQGGFLITDALDAIRDVQTQKMVRRLLRSVQRGESRWTVLASVREFDLKYGRELREAFPGHGVSDHASTDFSNVAHFHLTGLSEQQLDALATQRESIRPFIERARETSKSAGVYRSPFYLRLAADLLRNGVQPNRLADWTSPALLLRQSWFVRVTENSVGTDRETVLRLICQRMVEQRRLTISLKELSLTPSQTNSVAELRGRGILQAPPLRHGVPVGEDEIRFAHHLLHDYAITKSLIPETPEAFTDFAVRDPLLPIFYRQSFFFALEELWDSDANRDAFWNAALRLEGITNLHAITRILAPLLAARRVERLSDLQPLIDAIVVAPDSDSAAYKAIQQLVSGLQDADTTMIKSAEEAWCRFAEEISKLLSKNPNLQFPIAHILSRIAAIEDAKQAQVSLNNAACALLNHHVTAEVAQGNRFIARAAIEAVCRSFAVNPGQSEQALLGLLKPERLRHFPHDDLFAFSLGIKYLPPEGDAVVLKLFEAAFSSEPEPDNWEEFGGRILGMRIQSSDSWNSIRHGLAEYYHRRSGRNAAFMTEAACLAWNAVVGRRSGKRDRELTVIDTIAFRETKCDLVEDFSYIWGREFEHEEQTILSHFEQVLRGWAAANDSAQLNTALTSFVARNRTALMWTVFMEAGAEYPHSLGIMLLDALNSAVVLSHPDYSYAAAALLSALHSSGDRELRIRLEQLILDLPSKMQLRDGESRESTPSRILHAQNGLLGVLKENNIELEQLRILWRDRHAANVLVSNQRRPERLVRWEPMSDSQVLQESGVNLKDPPSKELFDLRLTLSRLITGDSAQPGKPDVENFWNVMRKAHLTMRKYQKTHPKMANDLWGYVVGAAEKITQHVEWPSSSHRWKAIRGILLKAASDPDPKPTEPRKDDEDSWPSWGWPAPRIDAARGLPLLVFRIGKTDRQISAALQTLCDDPAHAIRFNLAERLSLLERGAAALMWELIDKIISAEQRFSVLDAVLISLQNLTSRSREVALTRVWTITERATQCAPPKNHIHETLAYIHLFRFLRTGDEQAEAFVRKLIAACENEAENRALLPQLHTCRAGGWLTAGDAVTPDNQADTIRSRTWTFFLELLKAAQGKLDTYRKEISPLYERGEKDSDAAKQLKTKLDRVAHLVDGIAMQLYFASGAFADKSNNQNEVLTQPQLCRFWKEAAPLFVCLAAEPHPHTAHQVVQTMVHLMACAPCDIFLLATKTIQSGAAAGFQHESLAVPDVVKLVQRALADHRDIFKSDSPRGAECLQALLDVLDRFVEAGWTEARQLTHRLEEIYR
jgi:hypothetical protein